MTQKIPTPEERIKIYSDTLRLLRNIEKSIADYQLYRESITKSIRVDIPELAWEMRNGCEEPIAVCHHRIGEATEEKEKEVKE